MSARDHRVASAAAVLAMMAGTPAAAQAAGSRPTREYVQAAGQSDAFEMSEAETALAQSRDPEVRGFAQQMLQDHQRLSQTLMAATARAGLEPPPMVVGADQAPLLGALQSMKGTEFDRAYWRHQALAHRSALTVTQRYAASGDNPQVKQAAAFAVPIIEAHLDMAERMETKAGS